MKKSLSMYCIRKNIHLKMDNSRFWYNSIWLQRRNKGVLASLWTDELGRTLKRRELERKNWHTNSTKLVIISHTSVINIASDSCTLIQLSCNCTRDNKTRDLYAGCRLKYRIRKIYLLLLITPFFPSLFLLLITHFFPSLWNSQIRTNAFKLRIAVDVFCQQFISQLKKFSCKFSWKNLVSDHFSSFFKNNFYFICNQN